MLQISSSINNTPLKPSVNFGRTQSFGKMEDTETTGREKTKEEIKAEKLRKFAQIAAENIEDGKKGPSALKTFGIVSALTLASGLTAGALTGRGYVVLNELTGWMNKAGRKLIKGINFTGEKMSVKAKTETRGVKGYIITTTNKAIDWLKKYSTHGVEKDLKAIVTQEKQDIAKCLASLRASIKKANPDIVFDKKSLKEAVDKALKNDKKFQELIAKAAKERDTLTGYNLLKKGTKISAGTMAGAGALKESTADRNDDGVPDCVQRKGSHQNATKKVTEALIECAIDSCL